MSALEAAASIALLNIKKQIPRLSSFSKVILADA
jgi:hypothetical protein